MTRLTDAKIRTLPIPSKSRKKYADGSGLVLLVAFTGRKTWYLRQRVDGKEQMIHLGVYPGMGLADVRKAAEATRTRLAKRLSVKEEPAFIATFRDVAREWLDTQAKQRPPGYLKDI